MKKLRSVICLLLALILIFGILPASPVLAAEASENSIDIEAETEQYIEDATQEDDGYEKWLSSLDLGDSALDVEYQQLLIPDPNISTFAARASYQNGFYAQRAVIWTTNGEAVKYNYGGKDHSINHIIMHTVWYDGAFRVAYCIEPGKTVITNSDYDEVEHSGESAWGKLSYAKQRGVGLALLYGAPNSIDSTSDNRTKLAYQLATYMIIHEIILGWRQDVHPFAQTNDAYVNVFGGGTDSNPEYLEITGDWYSGVHGKYLRRSDIQYAYNYISEKLAKHDLVPSFASSTQDHAPTYTLEDQGDGTYAITLTDTTGILSEYTFTNTDDLTFTKSTDGKSVTISTANSNLGEILVAPTKMVPNVSEDGSAFLIWNAETGSQELCSLKAAKEDPVPSYFKVKTNVTGNIAGTKVTDKGVDPGGWEFQLMSGNTVVATTTSDSEGNFSFFGVPAGTYTVTETIPADSIYYCESPNPQIVTVIAGETAVVTFTNRVRPGSIAVQKVDTMDTPRAGAEFLLEWSEDNITWEAVTYSDSLYVVKGCCTSAGLTDGKLISGEDGMVRFEGLHPEAFYRLTETKAPDGLQLLADYAFEGQLPINKELTVSLKVVNAPVFTLPKTGSNTAFLLPVSLAVCLAVCVGALIYLQRKEL